MTTPLLGLIGRKRSGKDTFAAMLPGYRRVAFADPLRAAALALDPIVGRPSIPGDLHPDRDLRLAEVVEALGWERAKDCVPEVRRTLQRLGTDAIRAIDDGFWVRAAMDYAEPMLDWCPVVLTDCRFPNEADAIQQRGGYVVRILRPGPASTDTHPSETALDEYAADFVVHNDRDLEHLRGEAARIAASVA